MEIYNLKDKKEYIHEVAILNYLEWGNKDTKEPFDKIIDDKVKKIISKFDNYYYSFLILLDGDNLVGHISLFETDGDERTDLKPWYATMYVKKEYRGKGYSKILNDAILKEAKKKGFKRVYLKSDLVNYYEKFGAIYIEDLSNGEKLYYIDII